MGLPAPERLLNLLSPEIINDMQRAIARDGVVAPASRPYYPELVQTALRVMADEMPRRWSVDMLLSQAAGALRDRMKQDKAKRLCEIHLLRIVEDDQIDGGKRRFYALTASGLDWLFKHMPTEKEANRLEDEADDELARPED